METSSSLGFISAILHFQERLHRKVAAKMDASSPECTRSLCKVIVLCSHRKLKEFFQPPVFSDEKLQVQTHWNALKTHIIFSETSAWEERAEEKLAIIWEAECVSSSHFLNGTILGYSFHLKQLWALCFFRFILNKLPLIAVYYFSSLGKHQTEAARSSVSAKLDVPFNPAFLQSHQQTAKSVIHTTEDTGSPESL